MIDAPMTEQPPASNTKIPKALPRNLQRTPHRQRFAAIGGPVGAVALLITMCSVSVLGWVAWQKYGKVFNKVFAKNVSTSYTSRVEYFKSRIEAIESASKSRKFGFFSRSTDPKVLKIRHENNILIIDASDAREYHGSIEAAREIPAFAPPNGDADALILKIAPPIDPARVATLLNEIFIKVMDGAEENLDDRFGGAIHEIVMNDLPDK